MLYELYLCYMLYDICNVSYVKCYGLYVICHMLYVRHDLVHVTSCMLHVMRCKLPGIYHMRISKHRPSLRICAQSVASRAIVLTRVGADLSLFASFSRGARCTRIYSRGATWYLQAFPGVRLEAVFRPLGAPFFGHLGRILGRRRILAKSARRHTPMPYAFRVAILALFWKVGRTQTRANGRRNKIVVFFISNFPNHPYNVRFRFLGPFFSRFGPQTPQPRNAIQYYVDSCHRLHFWRSLANQIAPKSGVLGVFWRRGELLF